MKTFKDILFECENYPLSREYYEIMKESSELELMKNFIESQEYQEENDISTFTESFFMEKIDKERLTELKNKAVEKAKNLGSKIKTKLEKIVDAFISLMKKFNGILEKYQDAKRMSNLAKKLNETLDSDTVDAIEKTFSEIVKLSTLLKNASIKQVVTNDQFNDDTLLYLNIICTTNDIKIDGVDSYNIKDIRKFGRRLLEGKGTTTTFKYSKNTVLEHSSSKVDKLLVELNKLRDDLHEYKGTEEASPVEASNLKSVTEFLAIMIKTYNVLSTIHQKMDRVEKLVGIDSGQAAKNRKEDSEDEK